MKITRRQLKQIIQDAVMRQAIATPRTRGQNDRKGFSSGIYEEDEVKDESEDDSKVTLKEIRSLIFEELSAADPESIFDIEFEGRPGEWKYKIVDSDNNRSILKSFSEIIDLENLEIKVSEGPSNVGFNFKLGDIRGDWTKHELTQQIYLQRTSMTGPQRIAFALYDTMDMEIANNGIDIEVSPEEFVESYIFPSDDPRALMDGSTELSAIVYFDFVLSDIFDIGEPEVSILSEDSVDLTIPGIADKLIESDFYDNILQDLSKTVSPLEKIGIRGISSGEDSIQFYIDAEPGKTIGAHVVNLRNSSADTSTSHDGSRYGFELIIYKTSKDSVSLKSDEELM